MQEAKKFRYEIAFKTNSDCLQIVIKKEISDNSMSFESKEIFDSNAGAISNKLLFK